MILPGIKKLLMLLSCNPGGRFKGDREMFSLKAGSTFLGGQPVLVVIMIGDDDVDGQSVLVMAMIYIL